LISYYFEEVELRLKESSAVIADKEIDFREFSSSEGTLRCRLLLVDGSILEFMEYLQGVARLKYRFHLTDKRGEIRFRYDNAPHHNISTFPHHKHTPDGIVEVSERSFLDALDEVEMLVVDIGV